MGGFELLGSTHLTGLAVGGDQTTYHILPIRPPAQHFFQERNLDNSASSRQELATKLETADVDRSGSDWLSEGDFRIRPDPGSGRSRRRAS